MNHQIKKRLSAKDRANIDARYILMLEKYKLLSLEELRNIFRETKLSSNDKKAVVFAADYLLQKQMDEVTKMKIIDDNIEGE